MAHKPAPNSNVVLHDQLSHHLGILQDTVQQYWDPHRRQKSNQHTKQLLEDGGGNVSLWQCIRRQNKNGKNVPQRVHYINILHELKLSDISHMREGWNIHELDWNDITGTFIEKHKVTPSNCITRNLSVGKGQRRTRKTSDCSHQHKTAVKGERIKANRKKIVVRGRQGSQSASAAPGLFSMVKETTSSNFLQSRHTAEGSAGKKS